MIFRTPFILPILYPKLEWKVSTNQKQLFLTFDDGPVPGVTEFVLEELKRFNAKATFFCIGDNVRKHPEAFAKLIESGHTIGNHTYNHVNGWKHSSKDYYQNVVQCDEQLIQAGVQLSSHNQKFFRPPYGRIKRNQIRLLNNYRIIMWDVLTHDFSKECTPEASLKGSQNATRAGSIVVFHDSYKAETNLTYILPRYLEFFAEKGYSFKAF